MFKHIIVYNVLNVLVYLCEFIPFCCVSDIQCCGEDTLLWRRHKEDTEHRTQKIDFFWILSVSVSEFDTMVVGMITAAVTTIAGFVNVYFFWQGEWCN